MDAVSRILRPSSTVQVLGTSRVSKAERLINGDKDLLSLAEKYLILMPSTFWGRHGLTPANADYHYFGSGYFGAPYFAINKSDARMSSTPEYRKRVMRKGTARHSPIATPQSVENKMEVPTQIAQP